MKCQSYRVFSGLLSLLVCLLIDANSTSAQTIPVQPQPFYDQCQSLTEGTSADDAVARAISSLKDKESSVRLQAAQQLSKSCDKRAVEPVTALLQDQELPVRLAAIEALGKLGDPNSIRSLNELIDDKEWRIRLALVGSLASFNNFHARNLVVNGIANPSGAEITDVDDMRVRCAAILTANQMKDVAHSRKSILFLYLFLQSKHEPIRQIAEQTMFALKNTRNGSRELIALLKQSHNVEARRWTAYWLGKLGIESGREVLTEVADKDPNARVKEAASEALKTLNGAKGT
ncbi:MAG: HEAT repeat domain-containing protein [Acidobacteria bacterium]|nr:HEAT repeat domain-containing protein [Acidobacteriota bacterium]